MQRIEKIPRPNAEEELELVRAAQAGDHEARSRLVHAHLRFVTSFALRLVRYGVPIPELVSEGTLGVLHAVDRFDPERGVRFVTYASNWIRAYVLERVVRDKAPISKRGGVHRTKYWFAVRRARARLTTAGLSGDALVEGMAAQLELPEKKVRAMMRELDVRVSSLDEPVGESGAPRGTLVPDDQPLPDEAAANAQQQERIREAVHIALDLLDDRERSIVERRAMSYEPTTLAEIGREQGISRERVRQLEARAMKKLRVALRDF